MKLADQWKEIEVELPGGWSSAQLSLSVAEDADADRAALILSSLAPGRLGPSFRLDVRPDLNVCLVSAETARAVQQIRSEAVDLSLQIASKILQRNLSKEDNDRLIQDALKQVEERSH